jgi:hypothetical protein
LRASNQYVDRLITHSELQAGNQFKPLALGLGNRQAWLNEKIDVTAPRGIV